MSEAASSDNSNFFNLVQATVRIRSDQQNRLLAEQRARGVTLADALRDNLDLAFALKSELAKIVEGRYDENDPKNAPRLVHSLLFRVEERILGALDGLSRRLENRLYALSSGSRHDGEDSISHASSAQAERDKPRASLHDTVTDFVALMSPANSYPTEVMIGAFLEILPRLSLIGGEQLEEIKFKGELWLEEHGYYTAQSGYLIAPPKHIE